MHPRDFTREQFGNYYAIGTADRWATARSLTSGNGGMIRGRFEAIGRDDADRAVFGFVVSHHRTGEPTGGMTWVYARDVRGLWADLEAAQVANLRANREHDEDVADARDEIARTARLAVTGMDEDTLPYEVREILAGNMSPGQRLKTLTARELVTLLEDVRYAGGDA